MPEWAIALISIAGSALISGVVGFLVKRSLNRWFKRKDDEEAKKKEKLEEAQAVLEKKKTEELAEMINKIVEAHTDSIDSKLDEMEEKLNKVANGTRDTLRDRILSTYYKCIEKGYKTEYDIENLNHMSEDYDALNGNSFVEECLDKLKNIPSEKEYWIKHKKTTNTRRSTKKSDNTK